MTSIEFLPVDKQQGSTSYLIHSRTPILHMASHDKLTQAIDYLAQGDWKSAHVIAQEDESKTGCWIHGVVHVLEGDLDNARYWYRRAGREFPKKFSIDQELASLRESFTK